MFRQVDLDCEDDHGASGGGRVEAAAIAESPRTFMLLSCPPLDGGNFALLKRDETGRASLLLLGRLPFAAPTLNLALIRRRGAELGASEVRYWTRPAGKPA